MLYSSFSAFLPTRPWPLTLIIGSPTSRYTIWPTISLWGTCPSKLRGQTSAHNPANGTEPSPLISLSCSTGVSHCILIDNATATPDQPFSPLMFPDTTARLPSNSPSIMAPAHTTYNRTMCSAPTSICVPTVSEPTYESRLQHLTSRLNFKPVSVCSSVPIPPPQHHHYQALDLKPMTTIQSILF